MDVWVVVVAVISSLITAPLGIVTALMFGFSLGQAYNGSKRTTNKETEGT